MKWIRWDGSDLFDFKINKPAEGSEDWDQCLAGEYVVCEKHDDWREIESGTLNLEDGKLHITMKPLPEPEKLPTLLDAHADAWDVDHWSNEENLEYESSKRFARAYKTLLRQREAANVT